MSTFFFRMCVLAHFINGCHFHHIWNHLKSINCTFNYFSVMMVYRKNRSTTKMNYKWYAIHFNIDFILCSKRPYEINLNGQSKHIYDSKSIWEILSFGKIQSITIVHHDPQDWKKYMCFHWIPFAFVNILIK